jgi:hypothetical protein
MTLIMKTRIVQDRNACNDKKNPVQYNTIKRIKASEGANSGANCV